MSSKSDMDSLLKRLRSGTRNEFCLGLKEMESFVIRMEETFSSEREKLEQKASETESDIKAARKKVPQNLLGLKKNGELEMYFDHLENQGVDASLVVFSEENIFRKTMIASLYFFLESKLNNICTEIHEDKKYPIKYTDLKGSGIVRAKDYLVKMASLDFSGNKEWSELQDLNKIRNCIVHHDSLIQENSKESIIVTKNNFLSTGVIFVWDTNPNYLKIEKGYIESYFVVVKNFLTNINKELYGI